MITQGRKTHFWTGALLLAFVIATRDARVKGTSWSAAWSWPMELNQVGHGSRISDEEIVEMLYSRPSRSPPDHPSLEQRLNFQKGVEDYENGLPSSEELSNNDQGLSNEQIKDDKEDYREYEEYDLKRSKPLSSSYMTTSVSSNNKPKITSYSHRIIH